MPDTGGGSRDVAPDPDDINSRLDEIAAELAAEAKFKEPSAAERARSLQQAPGNPLRRKRNARTAARLRQPVVGRQHASSSKATPGRKQQAGRGRGSSGGRTGRRRVATVMATVGILAIFAVLPFTLSRLHLGGRSAAARNQPARASQTQVPMFTGSDPFAGSPAEHFADGAVGIVAPAVTASVGTYAPAQVQSAYATVRLLLIAANLDRATLAGGYPAAFFRLLVAQQRASFEHDLNKSGLGKNGAALSSRGYVTSFAPGTTALVGRVVKVHGSMTAMSAVANGRSVLRIHADYLFVYPVQQAHGPAWTRMRIVQRQVVTVDFATWDDPGGALEPWISNVQGGPAGARCSMSDGYVHPAFPGQPSGRVPAGTPVDPYDQSVLPSEQCQAITGT